MKDYNNTKAREFFGDEIVNKLEEQHQDGYPDHFIKEDYRMYSMGDEGIYIVPFNNKKYRVIVKDNVASDPLNINQITEWSEL